MDRVRKALDRARLERAQPVEALRSEPPTDAAHDVQALRSEPPSETAHHAPLAASGVPAVIAYTRTRVFAPSLSILERNRVLHSDSPDPAAAAFRMLRTQVLQRMDANGWRTLAIFSPTAHDGKTTTAINLAVSLASDRLHTVLLVDFDFRRPSVAERLGIEPEHGSDDAMTGRAPVEQCLYHPEGFDRLVVMPARGTLSNSSEILAGPRSRDIVRELRTRYPERIVLYDLPPVLTADDALSFAPLVDCGLVVAAEGLTRRNDLVRSVELLHRTPLVGTVLNRAADSLPGY
jgi:Mrp family chromosome partitioning ATPase